MMAPRLRAVFLSVALVGTTVSTARADNASEAETCASAAEESQALRREGKLTKAREQLIICARASCPAFIRKDCTGWLSEVERNLPSVVVRAVDPNGKDVTEVRVLVDGQQVTEKLDGRPLSVDPGEHSFTYETAGAAPVTEKILVRQGETNRLVSVSFGAAAAVSPPPPKDKRDGIGVHWFVGGAGVVAAGVGAALWLSGTGDHSSMESGCARTQSCLQSDVDSAKTKLLVGDVMIGVGIVAIGAAVVLALVSKSPSPTAQAVLTHIGANPSPLR